MSPVLQFQNMSGHQSFYRPVTIQALTVSWNVHNDSYGMINLVDNIKTVTFRGIEERLLINLLTVMSRIR